MSRSSISCATTGLWLVLSAGSVVAPVAARASLVTEVHYVMGTYLRIEGDGPDVERTTVAMRECFQKARQFEEMFTRFDAGSELSRLNASSEEAVAISAEMAALLRRAIDLQKRTFGAFDVAAGALTRLWREATEWPSAAVLQTSTPAANGGLRLEDHRLVRHPGVVVDLDGIAKGWTVDACVEHLRRRGLDSAFISFGESSVATFGRSSAGTRTLEVRSLRAGEIMGSVVLKDGAVSVSSVFGHEHEIAGERVGHVVDPRDGQPLRQPAMVLALAESATDAEAFSKALLIRAAAVSSPKLPRLDGLRGAIVLTSRGIQLVGNVEFIGAQHRLKAEEEPLR